MTMAPKGKLTIGGMASDNSWMSDSARAQEFGDIIVRLANSDPAIQRKAYTQYYAFRRYFTREYWGGMLDPPVLHRLERWSLNRTPIPSSAGRTRKAPTGRAR